jgi:fatty acid desaturase
MYVYEPPLPLHIFSCKPLDSLLVCLNSNSCYCSFFFLFFFLPVLLFIHVALIFNFFLYSFRSIAHNAFHGTIPKELGNLKQLIEL